MPGTEDRGRAEPDFPALGELRRAAWGEPDGGVWPAVLARSLSWVTAHEGRRLVGFVNVAWDGGVHAFLLDTTVHPEMGRGVGTRPVRTAADAAREGGAPWLHVDFGPHLAAFDEGGGFHPPAAGLRWLG